MDLLHELFRGASVAHFRGNGGAFYLRLARTKDGGLDWEEWRNGKWGRGDTGLLALLAPAQSDVQMERISRAELERSTEPAQDYAYNPNQPRAPKGTSTGGQWVGDPSYNPGVKIKETKRRAWNGEQVALKNQLSKQEAGSLGERILIAWLRKNGMKDASPLNVQQSNFPVDLVQDHEVIEAKTGLVSNRADAQKWRATIGQPGKAERVWLKTASPEAKAKWNASKRRAIMERKAKVVAEISKQIGKPFKGNTLTVLLNPDTKTADIYRFKGFHLSIRWGSEEAEDAYVGSVRYEE